MVVQYILLQNQITGSHLMEIQTVGIIMKYTLIVTIYILPNRPWKIIQNLLFNLLKDCAQIKQENNCETIIRTGDFKYDLYNPNKQITNLFNQFNITQIVKKPNSKSRWNF